MLGLYGQVVVALPSVNAVLTSFGKDMRPLEPLRQGVYPGFCQLLGLPCSEPEPVPEPKCGEKLECLGIAAQCYAGFAPFSHTYPEHGNKDCVDCVRMRGRVWADSHPE